ncbi:MAG TPA: SRPBCC family protein [Chroococcales cyanobacterium]
MIYHLERTTFLPEPRAVAFSFFADAHNLERITPEFLHFHILTPDPIVMRAGTRIDYELVLYGIRMKWQTLIEEFVEGDYFIDLQVSGPYRLWRHRHEFQDIPGGSLMIDRVDYELPFGPLGRVVRRLFVRSSLERVFNYRSKAIAEHFRAENR